REKRRAEPGNKDGPPYNPFLADTYTIGVTLINAKFSPKAYTAALTESLNDNNNNGMVGGFDMLLEEKLEPEEIEQYEEFNQVIRDLLRPERERIQVNEAM